MVRRQDSKKKTKDKVSLEAEIRDLVEKDHAEEMIKLKAKFEKAKTQIKQTATDYAIATFEEKTKELSGLFTREVVKMLR